MKNIQRIHLFENLLYATVLLIALCGPFMNGIFENNGWNEVLKISVKVLPFFLVFLIHNYLLVPRLLFTEKYLYYLLSCILAVVAAVCLQYYFFNFTSPIQPPFDRMPPPDFPFPPKDMSHLPGGDFPHVRHHPFFNFGQAIIAFLVLGFNSGGKSFVRWSEERVRQADRERQYLQTELSFLKHQISPHFFMNTLNNIHSLVDVDTEKARDAIVKLSRMMRYMLYEADVQKVSLKKEIEFIESYIELMRLRYDENILTVETEYPAVTDEIFIPSFLFLSFIENAFKHGVVFHQHSLICIHFSHKNGRLVFTISNNKSGVVSTMAEKSGIGLENVRKRLDLIFKNDYILKIDTADDSHIIYLNIPV